MRNATETGALGAMKLGVHALVHALGPLKNDALPKKRARGARTAIYSWFTVC